MKTTKFLIFLILFSFSTNLFCLFLFNESHNAYNNNDNIEKLIIEGAGYFLKSHSEFLSFLQQIETGNGEYDYLLLNQILDSAADNLENAKAAYNKLYDRAKIKSYNPVVTGKLVNFDYANYRETIKAVPSIYDRMKFYLGSGNVTGLYLEFYTGTSSILTSLKDIKKDIEQNAPPAAAPLRGISQEYARLLLLGQYTAEIFANL